MWYFFQNYIFFQKFATFLLKLETRQKPETRQCKTRTRFSKSAKTRTRPEPDKAKPEPTRTRYIETRCITNSTLKLNFDLKNVDLCIFSLVSHSWKKNTNQIFSIKNSYYWTTQHFLENTNRVIQGFAVITFLIF